MRDVDAAEGVLEIGGPHGDGGMASAMPAQYRNGRVTSAKAPANSH
jgi:hypothetical protein